MCNFIAAFTSMFFYGVYFYSFLGRLLCDTNLILHGLQS